MKKIGTLILAAAMVLAFKDLSAQCSIDTNDVIPGFTPASLSCITEGVMYGQALQVRAPVNVTISTSLVSVDSVRIDSILGLPTGIIYSANPASATIAGGANGCLWFSGNTGDTVGNYRLVFYASIWASHSPVSVDTTLNSVGLSYSLSVCAQVFSSCDTLANLSTADTPAIYTIPRVDGNGYITGSNDVYIPTELAEELTAPAGSAITGAFIAFSEVAINPGDSDMPVYVQILDNSGPAGTPGNQLTSAAITLREIAQDVAAERQQSSPVEEYVQFPLPGITNATQFFLAVSIPSDSGDTVALISTSYYTPDGDAWEYSSYVGAWDKLSDDYQSVSGPPFTWGLWVYAITCSNPPTALFEGAPADTGCAVLTVNFLDKWTGAPGSWFWLFQGGNPDTSTSQNPIVEYNDSGTYSVSLRVTGLGGSDSIVKSNYITVYQNPSVEILSLTNDSSAHASQGAVTITGTGGTPPYKYYWNTSLADTLSSISSLAPGTYTVTVVDAHKCFSIDDSVVISVVSGIEGINNAGVVQIYPNPAGDRLNINWTGKSEAEIEVLDLSGKLQQKMLIGGNTKTAFDIHGLASGAYLLRITDRQSGMRQSVVFDKM